jgi:hypothetical protein
MTDRDPDWESYARLQEILDRKRTVDSHAWGLEAGLNRLLQPETSADEADRTIRSTSRKERHQAFLRRRYMPRAPVIDIQPALEARHVLGIIERKVMPDQWALLLAIANGHAYADVALSWGLAAAAIRARVLRLRRRLRPHGAGYKNS